MRIGKILSNEEVGHARTVGACITRSRHLPTFWDYLRRDGIRAVEVEYPGKHVEYTVGVPDWPESVVRLVQACLRQREYVIRQNGHLCVTA